MGQAGGLRLGGDGSFGRRAGTRPAPTAQVRDWRGAPGAPSSFGGIEWNLRQASAAVLAIEGFGGLLCAPKALFISGRPGPCEI